MEHVRVLGADAVSALDSTGVEEAPGPTTAQLAWAASVLEKVSQIDPRMVQAIQEVAELWVQKNVDYGADSDPYRNVRGATEFGVAPWVGAAIRMNDKVRRLQQFATTGTLANEGVEDSFLDIATYSLIALILFREQQQ